MKSLQEIFEEYAELVVRGDLNLIKGRENQLFKDFIDMLIHSANIVTSLNSEKKKNEKLMAEVYSLENDLRIYRINQDYLSDVKMKLELVESITKRILKDFGNE